MPKHHPGKFAAQFAAKLASRSRHVCLLLGAGMAKACGLPDVARLQEEVREHLDCDEQRHFAKLLGKYNLEQALSRLRRIASLVSGDDRVDGLTADMASSLDASICESIVSILDVGQADLAPVESFAAWASRANYVFPVEVFTVNYDLLIEFGLESVGVPYFDGFVGTVNGRFRTELVEALPGSGYESVPPMFVRLWKLHGSVNWTRTDRGDVVRLGQPVAQGRAAAIYPSDAKYEESRRVPFLVLQDRFRRSLNQPETLLIISGYSFGDDHLNELIFDAAVRRQGSEFIVFCYSRIPELLVEKTQQIPNLLVTSPDEIIIGGLRAVWDESEGDVRNLWAAGKFELGDFASLARYLSRSMTVISAAGSHLEAP